MARKDGRIKKYGIDQNGRITAKVSDVETARVGFTCGPRVSKTGAAGAFINKTKKHGKSNAATSNDDAHSSNKSNEIIEDEAEI